MRRREFIALLGPALACAMAAAARAGAPPQLAPRRRSAPPPTSTAQVVPQPVPQVAPQLNVPGPQTVPAPPGNPVRQLSSLGGSSPPVSTGRIRRGAPRGRRRHRRHSG